MEEKKFYSLISDTTFKYLWRKEVGRKFYSSIILYLFHIDLDGFILIDNESPSGNHLKNYRLDVVLINDKHIINIEMNRQDEYIENRNRIYLHRIASNVGNSKSTYKELAEYIVEQINFNNFKKDDICMNTIKLKDEKNIVRDNHFIIHNIYVPSYLDVCYNNVTKKMQLLSANSLEEMRKIASNDKELNEVIDEVERLNRDKYFGALYDMEEENTRWKNTYREMGYDEGIEQGIEQGMEQASNDIALRLKNSGIDYNTIKKATGINLGVK